MPVKFRMQPAFPAASLPSLALNGHRDAPLARDPPQHLFTPLENWYRRDANPCSWHGSMTFPEQQIPKPFC